MSYADAALTLYKLCQLQQTEQFMAEGKVANLSITYSDGTYVVFLESSSNDDNPITTYARKHFNVDSVNTSNADLMQACAEMNKHLDAILLSCCLAANN